MAYRAKYVSNSIRTAPLAAVAAGKTGTPETITTAGGAAAAASKLVFVGNHIAGDIVTVGSIPFTAVASGAVGNQYNVGVDLATSINNLIAVLAASILPSVSVFVFTLTDTNTALTATPKVGSGTQGNTAAGNFSSTHATTTPTYSTTGTASPTVSLDTETTVFNNATGGQYYLRNGDNGQDKNLVNIGAGSVVVGCTVTGGGRITIPLAKSATLTWLGTMWRITNNDGSTVAA